MREKEGTVVAKGHEEGRHMAIQLFVEFEIPLELFPTAIEDDVVEVGFIRSTGYMWIRRERRVEHKFRLIRKLVSYDTKINGYVEKKRIKKLKGMKVKELMLWLPVGEITVVDHPNGNIIQLKSVGGITQNYLYVGLKDNMNPKLTYKDLLARHKCGCLYFKCHPCQH